MALTVVLTPTIKQELLVLAHGRNDAKTSDRSRRRSNEFTDLELDYLGIKGEYVAAEIAGVPFDRTSYGSAGDDNRPDLVISGLRYAIKTNHRLNGYLVVERREDTARADRLLLVNGPCEPDGLCMCRRIGEWMACTEQWCVAGWIPIGEFWQLCSLSNWGLGPRWWMRADDLRKERL